MHEFNNPGLSRAETVKLIMDYVHRLAMHHAMWFTEVQHQYGREKALIILEKVYDRSRDIQLGRLGKTLGFSIEDGIPSPLMEMEKERLDALKEALAVNWLANDGIWFQAVELSKGMHDAKKCNDSCWAAFSPFEAWSVRKFLGLGENSGLEGLKKALHFRLYAAVNKQSVSDENEMSFIFRMNECRVQAARKRKGLENYPCKSGGLVEYSSFAEAIDHRIRTTCLVCPPDPHPEEYYCAWKFSLETE